MLFKEEEALRRGLARNAAHTYIRIGRFEDKLANSGRDRGLGNCLVSKREDAPEGQHFGASSSWPRRMLEPDRGCP